MTVPITQSVRRFRMQNPTDPVQLSRWLRLLLMGASLALNPALAAAQTLTVPAAAAAAILASLAAYHVPVLPEAFAVPGLASR